MNLVADEDSYIVVDPDQNALEAGRIYAVLNGDNEATFKRFRSEPPTLEPVSDNPDHKPLLIGSVPFRILGRVTYVGRQL